MIGALLHARSAFAALRQEADVEIHRGTPNHAPPFLRQRKARDSSAGADLVAAITIFAAIFRVETQPGREETHNATPAEIRLDDIGRTNLGTVATPHADADESGLVQRAGRTQGRRSLSPD